MSRVINFSAGPAMLPEAVLQKAAAEMLDWNSTGMSVMEMSHRSKVYVEICQSVSDKLRDLMQIPANYDILFLQGGATLQFSAVPMNLLREGGTADYAVTGNFSKSAYKVASRYGDMRVACDDGDYADIPPQSALTLNPQADYFHYCHNNTVYGTVWNYVPATGDVPLVCDMSSSILSQPVDVARYGLIYAGAQKNMGPAGLTVVIVRKDLTERPGLPFLPALMRYADQAKADSMMNTPPTYGIYLLGLVLDWIKDSGGLAAMEQKNRVKAQLLYDALDASPLFTTRVAKEARSMMNVVFTTGDGDRDAAFCTAAAKEGMLTLKGHRAVGGMRASIYNAMPREGVEKLAEFIKQVH